MVKTFKKIRNSIFTVVVLLTLTCQSELTVDSFTQNANATSNPVLSSSTPAEGDTTFAINGTLQFTFDQTIVTSSVTANVTNTTCAGSVQLSSDNFATCIRMNAQPTSSDQKTFSVKPNADLGSGTAYKLKITQAVIGTNDKNVSSDIIVSFTAFGVDSTAPTVNSQNPSNGATGIAINTTIAVTFSEPMNTGTVTVNTANTTCAGFSFQVSLDNFANCIRMNAAPTTSGGNATFTVTPNANLANSSTYKIRITTAVQDVAGNALASQFEQATGFTTVALAGNINQVVISEVGEDYGSTTACDFIELYNPSSGPVDLSSASVQRVSGNIGGSVTRVNLSGTILQNGFYLIGDSDCADYGTGVTADDTHSSLVINDDDLILFISDQTNVGACADADIIDKVGLGANTCFEGGGATSDIIANRSLERKSQASDDATALAPGGGSETAGNGHDTNVNSADWVLHSSGVAKPQDSNDGTEP